MDNDDDFFFGFLLGSMMPESPGGALVFLVVLGIIYLIYCGVTGQPVF